MAITGVAAFRPVPFPPLPFRPVPFPPVLVPGADRAHAIAAGPRPWTVAPAVGALLPTERLLA